MKRVKPKRKGTTVRAAQEARSAQHSTACVEEAEETVKELRGALENAGIMLPTLRIDPATLAREAPCPLVELGRCSVETAARLAAVIG
nr:hypothetical protein [Streptomyces sporangiiformans]